MQDTRALSNSRNLTSWRAWERDAYRRSGFYAILLIVPLTVPFVVVTLDGRVLRHLGLVALSGFGLYLATILGLMTFATLRLQAWRRAHPWTPPEPIGYAPRRKRLTPETQ
jgi:hypothetical protein